MTDQLIVYPVDDVDRMLTLAEDMAEKNLSEYLNDNSVPIGKRNARMMHESCVILGKIGNSAGSAFRKEVSAMYTMGSWKELEIPFENDDSQMTRFEFFSDWLRYATEKAGISSAAASALNIFVENVVDPVAKRLVTHTDGTPFEIDEVLALKEGHTQRVAYAAKNILKNNPEDFEGVAEMLEFAQDPETTFEDLQTDMKARGLQQQRVPSAECNIYQDGDVCFYTIVMETPAQQTKIDAGLKGRVDFRTRSYDDMKQFWNIMGWDDTVDGPKSNAADADRNDNSSMDNNMSVVGNTDRIEKEKVTSRDYVNYLKSME